MMNLAIKYIKLSFENHFLSLCFLNDSVSLQMRQVLSLEPVIIVSP